VCVSVCVWTATIPAFVQRDLGKPHKVSFWITLTKFQAAYLLVKSTVQSRDQPVYFDNWDILNVTVT